MTIIDAYTSTHPASASTSRLPGRSGRAENLGHCGDHDNGCGASTCGASLNTVKTWPPCVSTVAVDLAASINLRLRSFQKASRSRRRWPGRPCFGPSAVWWGSSSAGGVLRSRARRCSLVRRHLRHCRRPRSNAETAFCSPQIRQTFVARDGGWLVAVWAGVASEGVWTPWRTVVAVPFSCSWTSSTTTWRTSSATGPRSSSLTSASSDVSGAATLGVYDGPGGEPNAPESGQP